MSNEIPAIGLPIQFDRMYSGPIDKYDVFDSYADAVIYAQGPIAFPGQILGVKGTSNKREIYVINEDRTLSNAMIQRENINIVLEANKWVGKGPYTQTIAIPYLEPGDNAVVNLASSGTIEHVNAIVQSKIGEIIQQENSIVFYANGSKPEIDIPLEVIIGSIVSAVEIPNNVNDNTNTTIVIAKADAWEGTKAPFYQTLEVIGIRPDSNGTVGLNPESAYAEKIMAAGCGLYKMDQQNNSITIGANYSKPTKDLEILVVWGDNIVVVENSDFAEDINTTLELVLKASEWSEDIPYTQTLRVEGLSEHSTGSIGISKSATPEQAQAGIAADLELTDQGDGYVTVVEHTVKQEVDIPVTLIYGANINIIPSPEYVGEANRHEDTTAFASKWSKGPDGYEQFVDVPGITSNSIGTMGIRQFANNLQVYAAAQGKIEIKKVYDNKVLLVAKGVRPTVNIPLCFVFGRNVNIVRYQELTGKVALSAEYIPYDDSKINYKVETVQQVLELLKQNKIDYADIVDNLTSTEKLKPLSANMGRVLKELVDTNNTNINNKVDELEEKHDQDVETINDTINSFKQENSQQHTEINNTINNFKQENSQQHTQINQSITNVDNKVNKLQEDIGNIVIKIQSSQPSAISGKKVVWIKI